MNDVVTVVQQGDQYAIRFIVKENDTEITDQNCDEMRIKIKGIMFDGENIAYDDGYWLCFVTQEDTLSWCGSVPVQAQWKTSEDGETVIKTTETAAIQINASIIAEVWSDE